MDDKIQESKKLLKKAIDNPQLIVSNKGDFADIKYVMQNESNVKASDLITTSQIDNLVQNIMDLSAQRVECARSLVELLENAQDEIMKEIRITEAFITESGNLDRSTHPKESPFISTSPIPEEEAVICICRGLSAGDMVGCDNPSCPFGWFHQRCVGLLQNPDTWFCPYCTAMMRQSIKQHQSTNEVTPSISQE